MDFLSIAAFAATTILGFIGGWAVFGKAKDILKEIGEVLVEINDFLDEKSEDGKGLSKAEVAKLAQSFKEIMEAFKK